MTDYQPTSRRPIADLFRQTAHMAVRVCIKLHVHPDTVSYASMLAAGLAALCFWQAGSYLWLLLLAPFFCILRLWLNMLDGMVALASGKASWRGEILNDLPDRVSDVMIFVGVAHSGLASVYSGYWAAIFSLLTAYVGMFGQAVGWHREFSGIMSKPLRMVVLSAGAWTMVGVDWFHANTLPCCRWTILDWTCLIIIVGCVQTIWLRLARIFRALCEKEH